MLNIKTVKAGQRITVLYASEVTWARKTDNPFLDLEVTKESTVAFTACNHDTYSRMSERLGHEKSGKAPWFVWAGEVGACVVKHPAKGSLYLAGVNHDTVSSRYLVGGKLATPEETASIREWIRTNEERERGLDFRVWGVDKLANACEE